MSDAGTIADNLNLTKRSAMTISNHLRIAAAACTAVLAGCAGSVTNQTVSAGTPAAGVQAVKFTEIRSAAIKLEYAGTTFLIDPMLASKGAYQGFPGTYNSQLRNPLVDLPMPLNEAIKADAVI